MAFETIITIQSEVINIDTLRIQARRWLESSRERKLGRAPEFEWLLARIYEGICVQYGPKGDMLLFGGVFSHPSVDNLSELFAQFIWETENCWLGNVILSWETEQSRSRTERVFWFDEGFADEDPQVVRLLYADTTPHDIQWCWGLLASEGPPEGVYIQYHDKLYKTCGGSVKEALKPHGDGNNPTYYNRSCACGYGLSIKLSSGYLQCDDCEHLSQIITVRSYTDERQLAKEAKDWAEGKLKPTYPDWEDVDET